MKQAVLILFLAMGCISFFACHQASDSPPHMQPTPTVKASSLTCEKASINSTAEAVGTIRPKASSAIQSKITEHILVVHVREGDVVQAEQILIELDERETTARLQQSESMLREAQQVRQEIENTVQAAEHAKAAALANSRLAETTYERTKGLLDKGAVSRQIFDEAFAKQQEAAAELARAGQMVLSAQAKRGELDSRIEQAQADVDNAKTFLTYTKIKAPFAGIVTKKAINVGDLASPGNTLLEIEGQQQYRLEAQVDEATMQYAAQGSLVSVYLDAIPGEDISGTVTEIAPSADPNSRTFVVKIELPNNPKIKTGMFGRVRFNTGEKEVLAIPVDAVITRGQLTSVFVLDEENAAHMRLITTGNQYKDRIEVLSGLDPGERIVTDNLDKVVDGAKVESL